MGKVCVVGAGELEIDAARARCASRKSFESGDWISIDGSSGEVYAGRSSTRPSRVVAS
jgi:pyruvate,orthophosphate dikinase